MNAVPSGAAFLFARGSSGIVANLDWERSCWRDDYRVVAGIDEAGRGALAGPIVAAAVCCRRVCALPPGLEKSTIPSNCQSRRRNRLADLIRAVAVSWAIGYASADEIDELGISRANRLCMERAVEQLDCLPDFALARCHYLRAVDSPGWADRRRRDFAFGGRRVDPGQD